MNGLSRRTLLAATAAGMLTLGAAAHADDNTIKVGVLATLEGAFTVLGQDSMRGTDLEIGRAHV